MIVLIEAAVTGAEILAEAILGVVEGAGFRCAAVDMDRQNRLAARLGCPTLAPTWCWRQTAPELFVQHGERVVVPSVSSEEELTSADVEAVLEKVQGMADFVIVNLGCRWAPRVFRPVLARATHVWVVVRFGQWSAVDMRLDQAEFSGWTDVDRIRLVVLGTPGPVPSELSPMVAAVLPEFTNVAVRMFVGKALGRAT